MKMTGTGVAFYLHQQPLQQRGPLQVSSDQRPGLAGMQPKVYLWHAEMGRKPQGFAKPVHPAKGQVCQVESSLQRMWL